jgi:DNA-binding protein HU-beta
MRLSEVILGVWKNHFLKPLIIFSMNKQELIDAIAAESGLSKKDSKEALDAIVKTVGVTLKKGENISLVGFGSFSVIQKAARTGKNPQTGKPIQIAAKKAVKFKPGKELADSVN